MRGFHPPLTRDVVRRWGARGGVAELRARERRKLDDMWRTVHLRLTPTSLLVSAARPPAVPRQGNARANRPLLRYYSTPYTQRPNGYPCM